MTENPVPSPEAESRYTKYVRSLAVLMQEGAIDKQIHAEIEERKSGNPWPAAFRTRLTEVSTSIEMLNRQNMFDHPIDELTEKLNDLNKRNDDLFDAYDAGKIEDSNEEYKRQQRDQVEELRKIAEVAAAIIKA